MFLKDFETNKILTVFGMKKQKYAEPDTNIVISKKRINPIKK